MIPFKIEIPRLDNQTTEDLTPAQLKNLLHFLDAEQDQMAANIMRLGLFTGMRRSEIFKLLWADIDFQRGFITLKNPKGGRSQTIPLNEAARQIFKNLPADEENPYVFPCRKEDQHMTDCKSLSRIARDAKLPEGFRPLHEGLR